MTPQSAALQHKAGRALGSVRSTRPAASGRFQQPAKLLLSAFWFLRNKGNRQPSLPRDV